ncbi:MAG: thioredoxin domain-containing protein, partial [bacterium]
MPNRLIKETSPYLLQHASNPVDWHPWDPEALKKAINEDKPILLSIGYSACHWCHVMEHESFEDKDIAEKMNRDFICIKVDREERPDLDKIYQTTHQMLTQRPGGWPLTVVLTPSGHAPFFAGTYFPPEPRHGMPGFGELLEKIAGHYQQNKGKMQDHATSFQ